MRKCTPLTFWLREDFGSLRKSSGSRLTFIFCDDSATAAATAADDDDATADVDNDDDDDGDDDVDDDVAVADVIVEPPPFAAPTTTDGCAPSNRPCISFGNRPDTSRGVVCPFNFVVVGALQAETETTQID